MSDLWSDLEQFDGKILENHALEILREQARLLFKKTNGKIKATFSKIDNNMAIAETIKSAISGIQ